MDIPRNGTYGVEAFEVCFACHNVHGSPTPVMIRHGELISTPDTELKGRNRAFQPEGVKGQVYNWSESCHRFAHAFLWPDTQ
jgi:hypothetical protein